MRAVGVVSFAAARPGPRLLEVAEGLHVVCWANRVDRGSACVQCITSNHSFGQWDVRSALWQGGKRHFEHL